MSGRSTIPRQLRIDQSLVETARDPGAERSVDAPAPREKRGQQQQEAGVAFEAVDHGDYWICRRIHVL